MRSRVVYFGPFYLLYRGESTRISTYSRISIQQKFCLISSTVFWRQDALLGSLRYSLLIFRVHAFGAVSNFPLIIFILPNMPYTSIVKVFSLNLIRFAYCTFSGNMFSDGSLIIYPGNYYYVQIVGGNLWILNVLFPLGSNIVSDSIITSLFSCLTQCLQCGSLGDLAK